MSKNSIRNHAAAASMFNEDEERTNWHSDTLWLIRKKRDRAAMSMPEWEHLRSMASAIKEHTLSNLDHYLELFEQKAIENGIHVHWAKDADEHNKIVLNIIRNNGINQVVKSKSMLTEECHLNDYLMARGLTVVDTDLGERIVQFRDEMPSHIVLPAIHLKKTDVAETFHHHLGTERSNADPQYLTESARQHLRPYFLGADLAITGVNFAVAETGALVVCTNEGNADMGAHAARVHIACMGIEKVIPKWQDLGVFTRLLARSATGQPVTTYTSHFTKPRPGQEIHVVLVDNGRTKQLAREDFRNSLKCIRCAACFNTCPVYRRSGGHSYHSAVAGPIGSILNPNFDMEANADLPFASTLCGSCTHVCPVKIDIHQQLWKWRQEITKAGYAPWHKKISMRVMAVILSSPKWYKVAGKWFRLLDQRFPKLIRNPRWNAWSKERDLPAAPRQSFLEWYHQNKTHVK
jgi:L-lactate dehydrogenase complex protein LldF